MAEETSARKGNGSTLRERAYQRIKKMIISGEIPPGTMLTETKLAKKLGMSRTPVRESILKLTSTGLVKELDNHGVIVSDISLRAILDVYDLQRCLEKFAVEEIINKEIISVQFDRELFDRLLKKQEDSLDDGDMWRFFQLNKRMHLEVLKMTGNEKLVKIMGDLRDELIYAGYQSISPQVDMKESIEEHREIVDALEAEDKERAVRTVVQHVNRAKNRLLS